MNTDNWQLGLFISAMIVAVILLVILFVVGGIELSQWVINKVVR